MSVPIGCPRCQGRLQPGTILGRGDSDVAAEEEWMDGPVEKWWTGRAKTMNRERFLVTTYRCERCGYLESYANTQVDQ